MAPAYLELKLSWQLFNQAPDALSPDQQSKLNQVAGRQEAIESAILGSAEAIGVIIPDATLAQRLGEIRQRYASTDDYQADLEKIGLDETHLAEAVTRDLRVEAVLEKVSANVPVVTEIDAEIYYRLHPAAFTRPEARRLRHILITFDTPADKEKARRTLEQLRTTLYSTDAFAKAALRHSQCPTAMEGGVLGLVKAGQLFPELEPAAFALPLNGLSAVLESPMGLHLMRCDEIHPALHMSFAESRDRIVERLTEKRRAEAQKAWIASLGKAASKAA